MTQHTTRIGPFRDPVGVEADGTVSTRTGGTMSAETEQYRERLAAVAWEEAWSIYSHRDGAPFVEKQCVPGMAEAVAAQVLRDVRDAIKTDMTTWIEEDVERFAADRGIYLGVMHDRLR